ncbi:MAG: hypothetical protein KDG55_11540 [Rhodocyclaceae bacterium]|nr:hypothetical protein [Rhodocyclaceae bacterium]
MATTEGLHPRLDIGRERESLARHLCQHPRLEVRGLGSNQSLGRDHFGGPLHCHFDHRAVTDR